MSLILQILAMIEAGLTVAPELATAAKAEYAAITGGTAITPDQQAAIDAALTTANAALQAA